jgi:hypothetical protein
MTPRSFAVGALVAALLVGHTGSVAHALGDEDLLPASRNYVSPERFIVEFRVGPYTPDMDGNRSFRTFFSDDLGPMLDAEIDVIAFRLDDILYLTAGGSIGHTSFTGSALGPSGPVSEETSLSIIPLVALASLRIDALPRKLNVPFTFGGKLGWEWARWSTATGARDDASGWSVGPFFAGQLALDLDTFEPGAARAMDEEWGINHSFVLFELYHFAPTADSLPIGSTAWVLGLGFTF